MELGITRETTTEKSSLDLYLKSTNKDQCIVNSISYDITDHYPVCFLSNKKYDKNHDKSI